MQPKNRPAITRLQFFMAPFFIVGCGRSGTTLLRVMLDSHPELAIPQESLFIPDYLRSNKSINTLKRSLIKEYELAEWGLNVTLEDLEGCETAAELIDRIHILYANAHGKKYWGQKTPRFVRYGKLLKQHFPGSKFIHVVRDPRAVANSLKQSNVHRSNALYAAKRWKNDVTAAEQLSPILEVYYETLLRNPEEQLKRICDFLGISKSDKMLSYTDKKSGYSEFYGNIHKRLSERPDPSRIDAWRYRMPNKDQAVVQAIAKEKMKYYNYDSVDATPNQLYLIYLKIERPFGFMRQLITYIRSRRGYIYSFIRRKHKLGLIGDFWKTRYFS